VKDLQNINSGLSRAALYDVVGLLGHLWRPGTIENSVPRTNIWIVSGTWIRAWLNSQQQHIGEVSPESTRFLDYSMVRLL